MTPMEKKMYVLAIIQFHLRDIESCSENIKILLGDLKVRIYFKLIKSLNQMSISIVLMKCITYVNLYLVKI